MPKEAAAVQAPRQHSLLATLAGLAAILLWSTTVTLGRSVTEQLGPELAGAMVHIVASALLVPVVLLNSRRAARSKGLSWRYVVGCGSLFVINLVTVFLALGGARDRSQTVEVGLVNYLWPACTVLLSLWLLGNRSTWAIVPGTALAVFGVTLVLTGGKGLSWASLRANLADNPSVYLLGLAAAVSWGFYSNLSRAWGSGDSARATLVFNLATAAVFVLLFGLRSGGAVAWRLPTLNVMLMGASTAAAYSLWDVSMRNGNLNLVVAASYLTPFFSTLVSSLFLRVTLTPSVWIGCGLIIVGSFWSWRAILPPDDARG
ncbi:MAG: Methyl viologen resistance protein YddG [Chloroflexi bacterium ADurb.Bin180]|nr:MAG: Methyl viologen resistance protein YddG [Chloroflexi bacterium ADurb.Bin180]HNR96919.1 aromatic amino acid DMT transporter YddG [Anaerolineae bacterium]